MRRQDAPGLPGGSQGRRGVSHYRPGPTPPGAALRGGEERLDLTTGAGRAAEIAAALREWGARHEAERGEDAAPALRIVVGAVQYRTPDGTAEIPLSGETASTEAERYDLVVTEARAMGAEGYDVIGAVVLWDGGHDWYDAASMGL